MLYALYHAQGEGNDMGRVPSAAFEGISSTYQALTGCRGSTSAHYTYYKRCKAKTPGYVRGNQPRWQLHPLVLGTLLCSPAPPALGGGGSTVEHALGQVLDGGLDASPQAAWQLRALAEAAIKRGCLRAA